MASKVKKCSGCKIFPVPIDSPNPKCPTCQALDDAYSGMEKWNIVLEVNKRNNSHIQIFLEVDPNIKFIDLKPIIEKHLGFKISWGYEYNENDIIPQHSSKMNPIYVHQI